ncbi:hypothetical protein EMCRGX_G033813 [Ephydatia muelleri]
MATKRVLVTGASGLLGREVLKQFKDRGWNATGLAYSRAEEAGLVRVDLRDKVEVERALSDSSPTVVVHCAAERRPDVVDTQKEAVLLLNVTATDQLAKLCGEKVVLRVPGNAVLRVPILYGDVFSPEESAVTCLLSAVLNTTKQANMSDYEQRYPTHTSDVARVCVGLADAFHSGVNIEGVWHWSGTECHTKYTMACTIAELFGYPSGHLVPVKQPLPGTPRPHDSHLDCSKTELVVGRDRIPFRDGLKAALSRFIPREN